MAEAAVRQVIADEFRKNDKPYINSQGEIVGTTERYLLKVLPEDISAVIRAVATDELNKQVAIGNMPSQIIVDNMTVQRTGIDRAKRIVVMRFQDVRTLIKAVDEIYRLLQQVTRIQNPPKNAIVARNEFYLWLNGVNLGHMPEALSKLGLPGLVTDESVIRIVGPLVNYGRKLFWNPVGTAPTMKAYRTQGKHGVRFMPLHGASKTAPRFVPYRSSTLRRLARKAGTNAASVLASFLSGATPPGRSENAGQIVKRIIKRNPQYRGLHFSDGWVEHAPAIGWSKLADPRVPAFGVMFSRKGKLSFLG